MISGRILDFLTQLEGNNNRDWFHANKDLYNQAKADFEATTLKLIAMVNELDPDVGIMEPKDCIFRIFRDTRFSNDKTPYKNNFGAYISNGGRKSEFAGYYLHIQPNESFIACGLYIPDARILNAVRQEIYHFTDEYKSIINNPSIIKEFGGIEGDKLKTAPKGFDKNFEDIDLIKFKSFNLFKKFSNKELLEPSFEQETKRLFGLMVPFNQFFNRVIKDLV